MMDESQLQPAAAAPTLTTVDDAVPQSDINALLKADSERDIVSSADKSDVTTDIKPAPVYPETADSGATVTPFTYSKSDSDSGIVITTISSDSTAANSDAASTVGSVSSLGSSSGEPKAASPTGASVGPFTKSDGAVLPAAAAKEDSVTARVQSKLGDESFTSVYAADSAPVSAAPAVALLPVAEAEPGAGSVTATPEAVNIVEDLKTTTADGWQSVQQKTFLRWVNYYLSQRDLKLDGLQGLRDGHLLNNLLEILSGRRLPRWKQPAKTQVQRLDNLSISFAAMQREGVRLVNVRPQEIEAANDKILMALVWALIVHFQIEKIAKMAKDKKATATAAAAPAVLAPDAAVMDGIGLKAETTLEPVKDVPAQGAKAELLQWVNSKVDGYDVPVARDFSSGWSDGRLLSALTDVLLIEQANLISLLTKAAIEHKPEELNEQGKRIVKLSGDPLADTAAAIVRAENELRIPPLLDAADLVSHPNEQAVMTFIACFRDREQTLANVGQQGGVEQPVEEAAEPAVEPVPEASAAVLAEEQMMAPPVPAALPQEEVAAAVATAETLQVMAPSAGDEVVVKQDSAVQPVVEETTAPSVVFVNSVPAAASAASQSDVVISEAPAVAVVTEETQLAAVGSTEPMARPGTPVQAQEDVDEDEEEEKQMDMTGAGGVDANSASSPHPVEIFSAPTLSRSDEVKEVDVCMTNVEQQYVQAKPDGSLTVSAANTHWSVWTVVDSAATDIVYFRDHKGRYITSDPNGRVFMAPKSEAAKWTVIRGKQQNFKNAAGLYLTAADGRVTASPTPGMFAALTLNFPVIEGLLRKKGRSGLKRWQSRYFAYNGAIMSYWEKKDDAGVTSRPKGLYKPADMQSVSIDKREDSKFAIHFNDGKTVQLDAMQPTECQRWVHSLEMTGVKVV